MSLVSKVERAVKEIDEEVAAIDEIVLGRSVNDFNEYKRLVGTRTGLLQSRAILERVVKNPSEDED